MRLFFSRRIGLSDDGEPIPILAGTRLTGRQGAYSVGVLNIQQREQSTHPGYQFHGAAPAARHSGQFRHRRHRAQQGTRRAAFQPRRRVRREFPFRRSHSRIRTSPGPFPRNPQTPDRGNAYASRAGFNYQTRTWQGQTGYSGIGDQFNDEMGFVPRLGIHNFDGRFGRYLRPVSMSKWLRQMQPHIEFDVFTAQDGGLDTALHGYHWNLNLQDGVERRDRRQPADRSDSGTVHDQQFKRNPS